MFYYSTLQSIQRQGFTHAMLVNNSKSGETFLGNSRGWNVDTILGLVVKEFIARQADRATETQTL